MAAFGFQQLLVVFSVLIFLITLFLLTLTNKRLNNPSLEAKPKPKSYYNLLYWVHWLLFGVFIALGVYSVWTGMRPTVYFVLLGALFVSSLLLLYKRPNKKQSSILPLVFLTLITVSVFQTLAPLAQNRLMVFGPDQWTYIINSNAITKQATFAGIGFGNPYYSTIPLFDLLLSSLTVFTGDVFLASAILTISANLVMALAIYLVLFKLSKQHIASVVGVFIYLSVPHLSLIADIPSTMSLALGALIILLIVDYISSPKRNRLVAILLLAFSTVIFHPAGIIAIIALCAGLVLALFIRIIKPDYLQSTIARGLLVLTFLLSLIYWCSTDPIFKSVVKPLTNLLTSIPSTTTTTPTVSQITVYTPNYFQSGFEFFSFAWALPVGIAAAYALYFLLTYRKKATRSNLRLLDIFSFVAAAIGLLTMVLAFSSVINAPSASVERYVDTPAYLLLLIPTAIISYKLLSSKQKTVQIVLIAILVSSIFIGASSPDWAPFENPQFAAVHFTAVGYVEAQTIVTFLPNGSMTLISDHDIGVDALASSSGVPYQGMGTYQIVRNILSSIKDGAFNPLEQSYTRTPYTFYTVRLDEVNNATSIDNYLNILYNSGMHVTVEAP